MSQFAKDLVPTIKKTLRETSPDFDDEIESYIDGSVEDLKNAGILSDFFIDSKKIDSCILQAIRYYCLANYGLYNLDSEKYFKSYESMKATLCVQRKYIFEEVFNV